MNANRWRADRKAAALSSRPLTSGALNTEPRPRRWPWLAILALGFLGAGWLCGWVQGRATATAWAAAHPCTLAPGGAVKVEQAGGNGMLYTCSATGEILSRIPWTSEWVRGVAP